MHSPFLLIVHYKKEIFVWGKKNAGLFKNDISVHTLELALRGCRVGRAGGGGCVWVFNVGGR